MLCEAENFIVYLVSCLGCCLLTIHDLPHDHHHSHLLSLHQESLLGGLQDLIDLQRNHILLPLPFGFSGSSTDTEREMWSVQCNTGNMSQHQTYLGELTEVFINPPPWLAFHILNTLVKLESFLKISINSDGRSALTNRQAGSRAASISQLHFRRERDWSRKHWK